MVIELGNLPSLPKNWAPTREFFLGNPHANDIRDACKVVVYLLSAMRNAKEGLDIVMHPLIRTTADELMDMGVKPNMHGTSNDNLPWKEIRVNPVKTAEFAAGILLTVVGQRIVTNKEAALAVEEIGQPQQDGIYKIPLQQNQRPDKLNAWIMQTALITHVCKLLDILHEEFRMHPKKN